MAASNDLGALARALLALAERDEPCGVTVVSGQRRAELLVDGGRLCAVQGVDGEPLGDTLIRHGVLDVARHAAALEARDEREPVGRWLVRIGAANAEAVRQALTLQAIERLCLVLAFPYPQYVLRRGAALLAPPPEAGVSLTPAVWLALLRVIERHGAGRATAMSPTRLSPFGERLRTQLRAQGLATENLEGALRGDSTQASVRAALDALGATRNARAQHGDAHALLLRKRGEVRRSAAAHVLLDVDPDASVADAKRAFRKLVRELHPDRFGGDNAHIAACSSEVLRALSLALRRFVVPPSAVPASRSAVR